MPGRERWWDGASWTEHYRANGASAPNSPSAGATAKSSLVCPKCGSHDVKTLKMIYAQGTSTGTASTTGWVQGSGNQPGHMATFSTTTKSYTEAARAAAPPRKRFSGLALIITGVAVGGILGSLGYALGADNTFGNPTINVGIAIALGFSTIIAGVSVAMRDSGYNREEYPKASEQWNHSWQCQRCGTVSLL